ncbi:MAG: hypothetical protein RL885_32315 [Planctomycetota bacterium]
MIRFLKTLGTALALAAILSPFAAAAGRTPGSVLIYPIYDSNPGSGTLISITNTKNDPSFNPATNLNGVVDVHFIYIDGEDWNEFNRYERLTPNDTFSVLADTHDPNSDEGFLYCIAIDPISFEPVSFNWLIGDEIVADSNGNWLFGVEAISFKSLVAEGTASDVNANGLIDLDGVEFEAVADEMYISSFFGQGAYVTAPTPAPESTLVLLSLVGDSDYRTTIDFAVYNNNEQEFSATHKIRCWEKVKLEDIDGVFSNFFLMNTNWDQTNNGYMLGTTGWARLDGQVAVDIVGNQPALDNPPFVGLILQALDGFAAGHLLHESDAPNERGGVLDTLQ